VERNGSKSCITSWKIWQNLEERWQFQQKSINEQSFSTLPSDIMPLRPVGEGDQSKFKSHMAHGYFFKGDSSHLGLMESQLNSTININF
jgi:hypothetical protein